jgi:hypothetical protein
VPQSPFPFLLCSLLGALCLTSAHMATRAGELLVDNEPDRIMDGEIRAELRGVRVVTTSDKFLQSALWSVSVPKDVIVDVVKSSPQILDVLKLPSYGLNELTFSKIARAASISSGNIAGLKTSNRAISGTYCIIPERVAEQGSVDFPCDSTAKYNAEAVAELLLSGGLDLNSDIKTKVDGKTVDLVRVRPDYAESLLVANNNPEEKVKYSFWMDKELQGGLASAESPERSMEESQRRSTEKKILARLCRTML